MIKLGFFKVARQNNLSTNCTNDELARQVKCKSALTPVKALLSFTSPTT